jgi:IS5 family transposase
MKTKRTKGFFDEEFRIEKISSKDPLTTLSIRVNWEQFRPTLERAFQEERTSNAGRKPFDRLLMFKVLILQEYYGLSDDQMEFQLLDRLSFQKFIGQGLHDIVPDAKTIWLFRNNLTKAGVIDGLFATLSKQLKRHGLIAKKGVMVDASFAKVPVQRNTPDENKQIKSGQTPKWDEHKARQKDVDANWIIKGRQTHYGYKQHIKADLKSKLITSYAVTPASHHDSTVLNRLITKKDAGQMIYGDSAYSSKETIEFFVKNKLRPRINKKGYRYKTLTEADRAKNRKHSSKRCRIEHVFASIKQRSGPLIRAIGAERVKAKIVLRFIVYNLSRAVFLTKNNQRGLAYI